MLNFWNRYNIENVAGGYLAFANLAKNDKKHKTTQKVFPADNDAVDTSCVKSLGNLQILVELYVTKHPGKKLVIDCGNPRLIKELKALMSKYNKEQSRKSDSPSGTIGGTNFATFIPTTPGGKANLKPDTKTPDSSLYYEA